MRSAIGIGNRIREAEDLVVVGIVVLENHIGVNIVAGDLAIVIDLDLAFARKHNRWFVNDRLVFPELGDEFHDTMGVEERCFARRLRTLVLEVDGQSGIEKREFAQAGGEALEIEHDGVHKNRGIGEEGNGGSGHACGHFPDHVQRLGGFAAFESDHVHLALAADFRFEPVRQRIHALRADTVKTAGVFVGALSELAAGVKIGEHQFHRGDAEFRMRINRNAAAVVGHRNRAIDVNRHLDPLAVAGEMLVDRIVQHLENAVVQAAFIGVADVHARTLSNSFQTLQFVDLGGTVLLACIDTRRGVFGRSCRI